MAIFLASCEGLFLLPEVREERPYLQPSGVLAMYVLEWLLAWREAKRNAEDRAALRLFALVRVLESDPEKWADMSHRWLIARRIEKVAVAIENISRGARSLSPTVRHEVTRMALARAASIRKLEILAVAPESSTFAYLTGRIVADLSLVINDRWHELSESEVPPNEPSKLRRVLLGTIGAAVVIVLVVLAFYASKIGSAGPILISIMGVIAVGALNGAGVPMANIGRYSDVSGKVIESK